MTSPESVILLDSLGETLDEPERTTRQRKERPLYTPRRLLFVLALLLIVFVLWPDKTRRVGRTRVDERKGFRPHIRRRQPVSTFQGPSNRDLSTPSEREALTAIYAEARQLISDPDHAPVFCHIGLEHRARFRALFDTPHQVLVVASYSNSESVLQTAIRELTALASYLGPERVHVAVTEGGSRDKTPDLLHLLARALTSIGTSFSIRSTGDTEQSAWDRPAERIRVLAEARNWPIDHLESSVAEDMDGFDTVLIFNDVTFCAVDALELLYQRLVLDADMVCGLDYNRWLWVGSHPLAFYDTWVARTIEGKTFWDIQPGGNFYDGSLDFAHGLLATSSSSKKRYEALQPFQVFSCWNGALAVRAEPLMEPYRVRLRSLDTQQVSESFVFSQDLWSAGFNRIAVAPRARVGYAKEHYELVGMLNRTHDIASPIAMQQELISHWQEQPPGLVEYYDEHSFWTPATRPWNWLPKGVAPW